LVLEQLRVLPLAAVEVVNEPTIQGDDDEIGENDDEAEVVLVDLLGAAEG